MTQSVKRLAQIIHTISALWVLIIAAIIIVDVLGRNFFNTPFLGATEIIKNSVVSITFLQLPLVIYTGSMLRTTILYSAVNGSIKRLLRILAGLLGFLFFVGVAYSSWHPFLEAWAINEYEGEGALRVPTYPVRLLIILSSIFAGFVYLHLMILDITGRIDDDILDDLNSSSEGA